MTEAATSGTARRKRGPNKKNAELTKEKSELIATVFIATFEIAMMQLVGNEGALTAEERKLIQPSLARILRRLPLSVAGEIERWLDPVVLLVGLAMYGSRQVEVYNRKRAGEPAPERLFQEAAANTQQAATNGSGSYPGAQPFTPIIVPESPANFSSGKVEMNGSSLNAAAPPEGIRDAMDMNRSDNPWNL